MPGCHQTQKPISSLYARHSSHEEWELASPVYLDSEGLSDNVVCVKSLWDEDSLYFRFDVTDKDLWATQTGHDDAELFLDDMCEVLLDPRRDSTDLWLEDDLIYHVNLLGAVKDDRGKEGGGQDVSWDGAARCSVILNGTLNNSSDTDEGYVIEIAIPWTEIGEHPQAGMRINVNYGCDDRDKQEKEKHLFFLSYHYPTRTPSSFKTLKLDI